MPRRFHDLLHSMDDLPFTLSLSRSLAFSHRLSPSLPFALSLAFALSFSLTHTFAFSSRMIIFTIHHRSVHTLSNFFFLILWEHTWGGSTCCVIWTCISIPPFKYFRNSWVTTGTWWILLKRKRIRERKKKRRMEYKLRFISVYRDRKRFL